MTPRLIPPSLDLLDTRIEPEAQVYAWAKLEGGARFESTLRFEAIEAQGGVKLEGSLAREEAQAKADDYASSYKASFALAAGPSGAAETFLKLAKVAVSLLQFTKEIPIGGSPAGTSLGASPETFKTGDSVKFALKLDPKTVQFPVVGYNVESVRVYRKEGTSLVLANEVLPQGEQVDFEIPWVATVDGELGTNFVAFVKTKLVDPRIEVATSQATGPSELILHTGEKLPLSDSYSWIDDDFGSEGATAVISNFYFSSAPSGVLVCAKEEVKASSSYVQITLTNDANDIKAGKYTFGGGNIGSFSANQTVWGAAPACMSSNGIFWQSGSLTITGSSPAGYSGSLTLTDLDGKVSKGTFSNVAHCRKASGSLALKCVP